MQRKAGGKPFGSADGIPAGWFERTAFGPFGTDVKVVTLDRQTADYGALLVGCSPHVWHGLRVRDVFLGGEPVAVSETWSFSFL